MHRHCPVLAFPVFVTSVFFKISAITQFILLLYKVYHCFLTFSSVQDIFFKIFSIFLNFGCSGNGKQVIWAMNCADFEIRRAEQTKMRKLLTPTPKVGRENNGFYRGVFAKSELEIIFLPRYKNKPQGSSDGVLGFNTFFDFIFTLYLQALSTAAWSLSK